MVHSCDVQHAPIAELALELYRLAVDAMTDWKVPGSALAVVQDGELALAKACGQRNIEANLPVTTATQFVIGSITKSFTATGVALLRVNLRRPPTVTATAGLSSTTEILTKCWHRRSVPRH
jgi:hypothetical protein